MKKIKVDHIDCVAIPINYRQSKCKVCLRSFAHQEICFLIPIHDSFMACRECSAAFNMKETKVYWKEGEDK